MSKIKVIYVLISPHNTISPISLLASFQSFKPKSLKSLLSPLSLLPCIRSVPSHLTFSVSSITLNGLPAFYILIPPPLDSTLRESSLAHKRHSVTIWGMNEWMVQVRGDEVLSGRDKMRVNLKAYLGGKISWIRWMSMKIREKAKSRMTPIFTLTAGCMVDNHHLGGNGGREAGLWNTGESWVVFPCENNQYWW